MNSYKFLLPDGYIYTKRIDPKTSLSDTIAELRAGIFNEDEEQFDGSVQDIKFFYSGIFLNNEFLFSQIKYKDKHPLKVYIKPTPEALEAKSEHYKKIEKYDFRRTKYSPDEKKKKIKEEEEKIKSEITKKEIKEINSILPQGFNESLMILFYLEANRDANELKKYFANIPE